MAQEQYTKQASGAVALCWQARDRLVVLGVNPVMNGLC